VRFRLHEATSRQLRRRSSIFCITAIVLLTVGGLLFIGEYASLFFGVKLGDYVQFFTMMGFVVPGSLFWIKSRDYALWAKEEAEREHQAR